MSLLCFKGFKLNYEKIVRFEAMYASQGSDDSLIDL